MIKKLKHQNITFIFNNKTNIKNRKIYKIQVSKFIYQLNGCTKRNKRGQKVLPFDLFVGDKTKRGISKWRLQEKKARQIFRKTDISSYVS